MGILPCPRSSQPSQPSKPSPSSRSLSLARALLNPCPVWMPYKTYFTSGPHPNTLILKHLQTHNNFFKFFLLITLCVSADYTWLKKISKNIPQLFLDYSNIILTFMIVNGAHRSRHQKVPYIIPRLVAFTYLPSSVQRETPCEGSRFQTLLT